MSDKKPAPEPSLEQILVSIRRILAEDEQAAIRPPPRARATSDVATSDVLDLTEAIDDTGKVRHIAPLTLVTPQTSKPVLSDGRIEPVPPRPEGAATEPRLVSEAASEAVASSFARLASLQRGDELDEMVRDMLRPMLQAWLDQHLPLLVERLVRAEIARVVGASPTAP